MHRNLNEGLFEYRTTTKVILSGDIYGQRTSERLCHQKQSGINRAGSVGSSGFLERFTTDYDLPNDSNYSETCATIALAMFGKRMADMEKDASYMDVVERALYNTL